MRLPYRVVVLLLALILALITGALAAARQGHGPSLLAYVTQRDSGDIAISWPGRAQPWLWPTSPASESRPGWSGACASDAPARDCRLAYVVLPGAAPHPYQVTVMIAALGGRPQAINQAPGQVIVMAWSPDGRWLAFDLDNTGQSDIYVAPAAGGDPVNLTAHPQVDLNPHWSPDGRQIAFVSFRGSAALNNGRLFVATLGAANDVTGLAEITDNTTEDTLYGWSPDGAWLLFTSEPPAFEENPDLNWEPDIVIARPDGSARRSLTDSPAYDGSPAWSPDGAWIAFESGRDGNREIYLIRPDGSGLRNLSADPAPDQGPVWSPDGAWIAFESERDGNREIYVVRPDGSGLRNVTAHPAQDQAPLWSPGGRWIAFETLRDGNREVYAVRPDGSGVVNISRHPGVDGMPAWSPGIACGWHPTWLGLLAGALALAALVPWRGRA